VLDEEVEQAGFVIFDFGDLLEDLVGYEVGAAAAGGEGNGFLCPDSRGQLHVRVAKTEIDRGKGGV
jgi:hypothetical protein